MQNIVGHQGNSNQMHREVRLQTHWVFTRKSPGMDAENCKLILKIPGIIKIPDRSVTMGSSLVDYTKF